MKQRSLPVLLVSIATFVAVCSSQGRAHAAARSVAVLPLELKGKVTDVAEDTLSSRLIQALAGASFQVVAGDVAARSVQQSNGRTCTTSDCNREVAERLEVQFLVAGAVDVKRKDYGISLELFDGPTGKSLGKVEERCDLCGIREVGDKMDRLAKSLDGYTQSASPAPARLSVETDPPGAQVKIDGEDRGTTPLTLRLAPGDHKVAFAHAGHVGQDRTVELEEGGRQRFLVALAPAAADGSPAPQSLPSSAGPWRAMGWTAVAAGAVAAAVGAYLLVAVDGEPLPLSECPADTQKDGKCTRVRDARLPGGMLVGAGAATTILGGVTLIVSRPPSASAADSHAFFVNARGSF